MANASQKSFALNGVLLKRVFNVNASPQGGESAALRGITRDRRAQGWQHGQDPDWQLTLDEVERTDGLETDWPALKAAKTEFTFAEITDTRQHLFHGCVVQSYNTNTDESGSTTYSVTVGALYDTWE